ncbi:MinD/ParA family ATP-binding protein [Halobacterium zhouii]|uniref:MinD/ParA family ATP-binding protein n=1 Tax=Halobacterium zhouii TaxID=2902624 RepID=UPI001E4482E7|nr:AAA family ATPase [Halobacterium zhouii]
MLAVAGGKGGCGKTTTALGLARAFAQRRRRPLVVDCDLDAPNLHLRADVPRDPGLDVLQTPESPSETHQKSLVSEGADAPANVAHPSAVLPGVDVLPVGSATGDDLTRALDALDMLPDDRPVLLDCPAGASEAATRPLRAADGAVVVATDGREEIEDAVKTAAMARAVGTPVLAVVVSRVHRPPGGLTEALGAPHVTPVPPADTPLSDERTASAYAAVADAVGTDF